MFEIMILLHVIGAIGMGFYLVLPMMIGKASKLAGAGQEGLSVGLLSANRIAQYFLVLQFLTGGYLISQAKYAVVWIVLIMVLFLAIAAIGGIVSKPLKAVKASIQSGQSATAHINKARVMSLIILLLYVAMIIMMKYPMMR